MFPTAQISKLRNQKDSLMFKKYKQQRDDKKTFGNKQKISRSSLNRPVKLGSTFHNINPLRSTLYEDNDFNQPNLLQNQPTVYQRKSLKRLTKTIQNSSFNYLIKFQGNNTDRVSQILNKRGCWNKCVSKSNQNQINFYWNISNIINSKNDFSLFSRISGSYELTDKARLYEDIVDYCSRNKISNELFLPVTFCFTSKQTNSEIQNNAQQFLEYFQYIKNHTTLTNSWIFKPTNLNRGRQIFLFNTLQKLFQLIFVGTASTSTQFSPIKKQSRFSTGKFVKYDSAHYLEKQNTQKNVSIKSKKIIPNFHFNKDYLKNLSKYQSIQKTLQSSNIHTKTSKKLQYRQLEHQNHKNLYSSISKQNYLIKPKQKTLKLQSEILKVKSKEIKKQNVIELKQKQNQRNHKNNNINLQDKLYQSLINLVCGRNSQYGQKSSKKQIVIQKYIQNPYLINGNKFDIRIWVLVDQDSNYYIFRSGYLRFSSIKYKLDDKSIQNNFIHLTNHAVQKYSQNYQKQTNLVKMLVLKDHMEYNWPNISQISAAQKYEQILNEIQRIISISLEATLGKFFKQQHNQQKYKFNTEFEIFGYDFLLDRELNVRLIQANCNPSITQDSEYLTQAVPRMLNDAFKLTIDKVFLPKQFSKQFYPMEGFTSENLWKKLGKIGQTDLSLIKNSFQ